MNVSGAVAYFFAFSPEGKLVFTSAGSDRNVDSIELSLWDAATGKLVRSLPTWPKP